MFNQKSCKFTKTLTIIMLSLSSFGNAYAWEVLKLTPTGTLAYKENGYDQYGNPCLVTIPSYLPKLKATYTQGEPMEYDDLTEYSSATPGPPWFYNDVFRIKPSTDSLWISGLDCPISEVAPGISTPGGITTPGSKDLEYFQLSGPFVYQVGTHPEDPENGWFLPPMENQSTFHDYQTLIDNHQTATNIMFSYGGPERYRKLVAAPFVGTTEWITGNTLGDANQEFTRTSSAGYYATGPVCQADLPAGTYQNAILYSWWGLPDGSDYWQYQYAGDIQHPIQLRGERYVDVHYIDDASELPGKDSINTLQPLGPIYDDASVITIVQGISSDKNSVDWDANRLAAAKLIYQHLIDYNTNQGKDKAKRDAWAYYLGRKVPGYTEFELGKSIAGDFGCNSARLLTNGASCQAVVEGKDRGQWYHAKHVRTTTETRETFVQMQYSIAWLSIIRRVAGCQTSCIPPLKWLTKTNWPLGGSVSQKSYADFSILMEGDDCTSYPLKENLLEFNHSAMSRYIAQDMPMECITTVDDIPSWTFSSAGLERFTMHRHSVSAGWAHDPVRSPQWISPSENAIGIQPWKIVIPSTRGAFSVPTFSPE